jgi:aryl carrier-like protein
MGMFGEQMSLKELSTRLSDMEHSELEYLVAPSFFTSLSAHFPGLIEHVEIIPKAMKASNELSCYRYAAVVHLTHQDETVQSRPIYSVDENLWIDFMEARLDRAGLIALLNRNSSEEVAVSNIPHSKTMVERYAVDLLRENAGSKAEVHDWVKASRNRAQTQPSLSAYDLHELAREAGFEVEISWARQSSLRGGFDAIFHRRPRPQDGTRVLFRFPIDASDPHALVSTRPLQQQARKRVWADLYDRLRSELPASMIPKAIHIIESIPVNPNGKVDRQRLGEKIQQSSKPVGPKREVAPEQERQMQKIWSRVLKVDAASIGSDSFFQLGGDSLAAMKLVGEVRKLGGKLSIADIFRQPALRDIALKADALSGRDRSGIPRTTASGAVDQSSAQGRIWFLEQLYPMLSWYLMPSTTRFRGPLNLEALQTAIFALESRHETLRTVFESRDGMTSISSSLPNGNPSTSFK